MSWLSDIFDSIFRHKRKVKCSPERYRSILNDCIRSAEQKTGKKLRKLKTAVFVLGDRETRSSAGDIVARVPGRECVGHNDTNGKIVVAYRSDCYVPAWAVEHEVTHQIARDHGLQKDDPMHCPEFRGKGIAGWV